MNALFDALPGEIRVKEIIDENFQDYKKPSMFIAAVSCDFKCMKELSLDASVCQNMRIAKLPNKSLSIKSVYERYISNPITQAVILGGLEPILQFGEIFNLISYFRSQGCMDDFVIYTGYYPEEIEQQTQKLRSFKNIIIKYGRFIPGGTSKYDEILGVNLVSENQHAERLG